jgi:hypothetical protein
MSVLVNMTAEQRSESLAKAMLAREAAKNEREANEHLYKTSYVDSVYWQYLAQKYSVRMPVYNQPCTLTWMRKYLNRVGVVQSEWREACGLNSLQHFIDLNPKMTLLGFVGNVLEYKNEQVQMVGVTA